MTDRYICPICGFPDLKEEPQGPIGSGTNESCPSCGFEFGFTDEDARYTYESWRARWIWMGMRWDNVGYEPPPPPPGWNPQQQLDNLLSSGEPTAH